MHVALVDWLPLLATEKSKTAFYVAGGALALWAVIVSVGLGLRRPDFPHGLRGERLVIGVSVVLVVAAMSTAVLTSGVPVAAGGIKGVAGAEQAKPTGSAPAAAASAPAGKAVSSQLALAADPGGQLRFDKAALKAPPGTVTVAFTNASPAPHNLTISSGSTVLGATPIFQGGSHSLKVTLKAGTYTFFCSVPGHREAGMQGTLTVA